MRRALPRACRPYLLTLAFARPSKRTVDIYSRGSFRLAGSSNTLHSFIKNTLAFAANWEIFLPPSPVPPLISDANEVPADTCLATDVCVIGSGAAGIALALALSGTGISVLLLESGRTK